MSIYYLEKNNTINEIISTIHAGVASMQYFEKMDAVCEDIGFNMDDAALLQRVKTLSDGRYADFATLEAAGITLQTLNRLKTAGLLLFVQNNEIPQSYVMLSRKTLEGLQTIAAVYDHEMDAFTESIDPDAIQQLMAAADKVFKKYQ